MSRIAGDDWKDLAKMNIRLVLFMKSKGIDVPATRELQKMYPLENYE